MIDKKLTSVILAAAILLPQICACDLIPDRTVETSLPTVPEESTSELTTTSEATEETTEPSAEERIILKTPDGKTVIDTTYVRTIADVTPEMMTADYWIGEDDNEVLMTPDEISEFNYNNRAIIKAADNKTIMPHLEDFGDTFDGNILKIFLNDNANSIPKDPSKYYLNGKPTTAEYWQELIALSNIENVPDTITVKYGFSTKRMTVRMFPTEDRVFESASDQYFDSILYSECMPYMPVYVLHESSDGEYLYVVFDSFAAWVRKDAIALCEDKEDWLERQNPEYWLTVTAREIRLGNDPYSDATTNLVLPMGTKMELIPAGDAPDVVSERTTFGDYVVKVPTRGSDGYVDDEYVLIPVSDDVTVGYLPFTSANIVRQALKLQGDRYGWGGDLQANDCTGIVREIYRCFGILMPRVGQSDVTGVYKVDMSDMDSDEKLEIIRELAPGSLVSFPGHMTIYLGTVDDIPFVISAVGTFTPPAGFSNEVLHPRTVVISSLLVRTRSYSSWLSIAKTALTVTPE